MRRKTAWAVMGFALLLGAGSLMAHHSTSAEFDVEHRFTQAGVLTGVDWINPHIRIYLDVKDASGHTSNWTFETNPPMWFKKAGIKKQDIAKAIGQSITVEGLRAKDGSNYGYCLKVKFADGTALEWNSLLQEIPAAK